MTRRFMSAHRVLFPAAVIFAVIMVPLWLVEYVGGLPAASASAAAAAPIWHAHEMIFGYAFAVVGGYLMTRVTPPVLACVFAAWLLGRIGALWPALPAYLDFSFAVAYPVSLFAVAGWPFLRGAKTGRNAVFAPLIAGLSISAIIAHSAAPFGDMRRGVYLGVDLLTLLLFVMGGRVIAAATSGAARQKGEAAMSVAQAGLERIGLVAILVMTICDLIGARSFSGLGAAAAGAVVLLRLVRWRWHRHLRDAEMLALYAGYGWLAIGLLLRGATQFGAGIPDADAVHAFTIGALGTLTLVMMGRASLQRARRKPQFSPAANLAVALLSAAAILRLAAALAIGGFPYWRDGALIASGFCWTVAFLLFGIFLWRAMLPERGGAAGGDLSRGS